MPRLFLRQAEDAATYGAVRARYSGGGNGSPRALYGQSVALWQLTVDCRNPALLVKFWAEVLDYKVMPPPEEFETWNEWYISVGVPAEELDLDGDGADRLLDPTERGPNIWFQVVPEEKIVKNRLHLDVYVGGGRSVPLSERRERINIRVRDLEALGGKVQRVSGTSMDIDHYSVVMSDPEGNEFCVA